MENRNFLFANPVAVVSVDTAAILRGERLAVVVERTNKSGAQRLAVSMSLEIEIRRDDIGVADEDNLTVTVEGVLVINGHSAVVENDGGKAMMEKG